MSKVLATIVFLFMALSAAPARAQIPVTDVAALTQHIQQVLAWGQQYAQMVEQISNQVEQINNQVEQINQLQNTYNSMTGSRGLGSFMNSITDQAARRYLPADMAQIYDLYNGTIVPGFAALSARISALRTVISGLPPGYFPAGSDLDNELRRTLDSIGTQRAMAEQAYRSTTDRIPNIESLMTRINTTTDPKEIAELQARISAEQVMVQADTNRLALLRYQQEVQRQEEEQRKRERYAAAQRAPVPSVTFPSLAY